MLTAGIYLRRPTRSLALLIFAASASFALVAAQAPSTLTQAQPGLWEISGVPGGAAPIRECVADIATLARFEHRTRPCSAKVLRDAGTTTAIDYSCGPAGFGHSD